MTRTSEVFEIVIDVAVGTEIQTVTTTEISTITETSTTTQIVPTTITMTATQTMTGTEVYALYASTLQPSIRWFKSWFRTNILCSSSVPLSLCWKPTFEMRLQKYHIYKPADLSILSPCLIVYIYYSTSNYHCYCKVLILIPSTLIYEENSGASRFSHCVGWWMNSSDHIMQQIGEIWKAQVSVPCAHTTYHAIIG